MRIIKPNRLQRGDVIGICAPASSLPSEDAMKNGIAYIERLGYRVHLAKNVFRRRGYLAGTDAQRTADLHELFSNRQVKAIIAARGGFGTQRLLPLLNYELIKRNPKIVVGYSDITALQLALFTKAGLVSLSGPLVVEMPLHGYAEELFWRALSSTKPLGTIRRTDKPIFRQASRRQVSTGRLIGGNLSLISAMLGSEYFPVINNPIIFLEEIDERPYRVDRTLQHLKLNGVFKRIQGIVLGSFTDCVPAEGKPSLTLREVFKDSFSNVSFPVTSGVRYGHVKDSLPVPIGIRASINAGGNQLKILASLVS